MIRGSNVPKKKHICPQCGADFDRRYYLLGHIALIHLQTIPV